MTRVSQSMSLTTIRPPERVTRTISPSTRCGDSTCWRVRSDRHESKESLANSRFWASPARNSTGSPAPSDRFLASPIISRKPCTSTTNQIKRMLQCHPSDQQELPIKKTSLVRGVSDSHQNDFYSTERSEIPFLSRVRISRAVNLTR